MAFYRIARLYGVLILKIRTCRSDICRGALAYVQSILYGIAQYLRRYSVHTQGQFFRLFPTAPQYQNMPKSLKNGEDDWRIFWIYGCFPRFPVSVDLHPFGAGSSRSTSAGLYDQLGREISTLKRLHETQFHAHIHAGNPTTYLGT